MDICAVQPGTVVVCRNHTPSERVDALCRIVAVHSQPGGLFVDFVRLNELKRSFHLECAHVSWLEAPPAFLVDVDV